MPMQAWLYPPDWPIIALALKKKYKWTCQECGARRGESVENRHGNLVKVQIGVAHLDHDPWNRRARLKVMCRRCHVIYDARDAKRKRMMMAIARGQLVLPGVLVLYGVPRPRYQETRKKVHKRGRRK